MIILYYIDKNTFNASIMTKRTNRALLLFFLISFFIISESIELKLGKVNEMISKVQSNGTYNPIEYVWNYTWDLTYDDMGISIIIDQNDNIFILGDTEISGDAIYLSKFNTYCNQEWEVIWGESINIRPFDMCMDNNGNIYVIGEGAGQSYLVKFNGSGQYEWHKSFNRVGSDHFSAVATDSFNHIYITGYKDTDGTALHEDIRIIKFYEDGTQIWDKTWGDGNIAGQGGNDIIIDANNFIFITGYDYSILDMVLIKFDLMGTQIWNTSWGTGIPAVDEGWTINRDENGNLYVGVVLNRYGTTDVSIVKFNTSGNYLWNATWGGSSNEYIYDITTNSKNEILCTGYTNSYGAGAGDVFLLRITDQGLLLDNETLGYGQTDIGMGVAVDSTNRIFLTGRFRIGGRNNFFLARYEPLPIITIYLPEPYQIFGEDAPDFSLLITDPNLDSTWYSINDGLNYTFTGMTGTINQTAWNGCEDGFVKIKFYANSTDGYFSFRYIEIRKDTQAPEITIISPIPYQLFGNKTIGFKISIEELNLNSTWYTLNDGPKYNFTGTSGNIDQTAWDACGNGTVMIKFFANDTSGYIGKENITVRKDTSFPSISVESPLQLQLFSFNPPTFNLTITGQNLDSTWYTLNDGPKYTFAGTSGVIDQSAWDVCGNGTVKIKFCANNTAGNIGYTEITVFEDIIAPTLLIILPISFQIFGNQSPTFNITIIGNDLNITWYTLNDGPKYNFTGTSGVIDQSAWDACGNGTVSIKFFANDTMGNIGNKSIIVYKDIAPPIIVIHSPVNSQVFGTYPPDYNLSISEPNIASIWYSLNDGLNYSISENSGKIDIIAWNLCDNGNVVIKFYANDTGGNTGYSEVIIEKNAYFWDLTITPIFIDNINPNYNWNKTARENPWCLGSGTLTDPYVIKTVIIDGQNSGSCIEIVNSMVYFRIENCILFNANEGSHPFYNAAIKLINANNGTLYNNTCSHNNGRGIFIRSSNNNTLIENNVDYNDGIGIDIDFCYINNYILRNNIAYNGQNGFILGRGLELRNCNYHIMKENNIIGNNLEGILLWDSHHNTIFNNTVNDNYEGIRLYEVCNDNNITVNHVNLNEYDGIKIDNGENNIVINNTVKNNVEHGINLFGNYCHIINNTASFNGKSGIYIHDCNYTLISFNRVNNNTENGILLYSMWELCESNSILNNTIFSNQMNGLLFMFSDKNNISGNLIENNQLNGIYLYSGSSRNLFYNNRIINNGLNALDDGSSNQWNNSIVGNFWDDYSGKDANDDGIGDSPYNISGTANSKDKKPIWWDSPVLSIISPESNTLFGISSLNFEISIDEGISDTTWYSLNNGLKHTFAGTIGNINQSAWDMFGNGTVTIRFYINDSRGYIAFREVVVLKDVITPEIIIISPTHNELFGYTTIYLELLINEPNLDRIWYSINNSENYFLSTTSGFIDQEVWGTWGSGTIIIKFYTNDTVGNEAFNEVLIRKDIFPPSWIVEPEDQLIEYGDDFHYKLDASDLSGISHWWINDTIHFNINDMGEITNFVSLSVGVYWLDVRVYDLAINYCNSTIKINVQDTTSPIWVVEPADQLIEYGDDFYYKLDASDLSGISHWWINDTIHFTVNDNGEITNVIDLDEGKYYVEIRAYDSHDNYCNKIIKITVKGRSRPPSIIGYKLEMIFLILGMLTVIYLLNWKLRKS